MDVREKLVELLRNSPHLDTIKGYKGSDCTFEQGADWLIRNGVTVQEWISVNDRLPETNGYHVWVIACVDGKRSCVRMFERIMVRGKMVERFKYPWESISYENITHWCELPQPQKGE